MFGELFLHVSVGRVKRYHPIIVSASILLLLLCMSTSNTIIVDCSLIILTLSKGWGKT